MKCEQIVRKICDLVLYNRSGIQHLNYKSLCIQLYFLLLAISSTLSFLSHFRRPRTIVKSWRCLGCNTRFTLKAHAANHQKQSQSITCRREGFIYDLVESMRPVKEAAGHYANLFIHSFCEMGNDFIVLLSAPEIMECQKPDSNTKILIFLIYYIELQPDHF